MEDPSRNKGKETSPITKLEIPDPDSDCLPAVREMKLAVAASVDPKFNPMSLSVKVHNLGAETSRLHDHTEKKGVNLLDVASNYTDPSRNKGKEIAIPDLLDEASDSDCRPAPFKMKLRCIREKKLAVAALADPDEFNPMGLTLTVQNSEAETSRRHDHAEGKGVNLLDIAAKFTSDASGVRQPPGKLRNRSGIHSDQCRRDVEYGVPGFHVEGCIQITSKAAGQLLQAKKKCSSVSRFDTLPEEILYDILCRLPLRDAAISSSISTSFGRTWHRITSISISNRDLRNFFAKFGQVISGLPSALQRFHLYLHSPNLGPMTQQARTDAVSGWMPAFRQRGLKYFGITGCNKHNILIEIKELPQSLFQMDCLEQLQLGHSPRWTVDWPNMSLLNLSSLTLKFLISSQDHLGIWTHLSRLIEGCGSLASLDLELDACWAASNQPLEFDIANANLVKLKLTCRVSLPPRETLILSLRTPSERV